MESVFVSLLKKCGWGRVLSHPSPSCGEPFQSAFQAIWSWSWSAGMLLLHIQPFKIHSDFWLFQMCFYGLSFFGITQTVLEGSACINSYLLHILYISAFLLLFLKRKGKCLWYLSVLSGIKQEEISSWTIIFCPTELTRSVSAIGQQCTAAFKGVVNEKMQSLH